MTADEVHVKPVGSDEGWDYIGKAGRGKHYSLLTVHVPSGV